MKANFFNNTRLNALKAGLRQALHTATKAQILKETPEILFPGATPTQLHKAMYTTLYYKGFDSHISPISDFLKEYPFENLHSQTELQHFCLSFINLINKTNTDEEKHEKAQGLANAIKDLLPEELKKLKSREQVRTFNELDYKNH